MVVEVPRWTNAKMEVSLMNDNCTKYTLHVHVIYNKPDVDYLT